MNKKIVLLAGNRQQARRWFEDNVVIVSHERDLQKLHGLEIESIKTTGTYRDQLNKECLDHIRVFAHRFGLLDQIS